VPLRRLWRLAYADMAPLRRRFADTHRLPRSGTLALVSRHPNDGLTWHFWQTTFAKADLAIKAVSAKLPSPRKPWPAKSGGS
jgi:hypothetical protein